MASTDEPTKEDGGGPKDRVDIGDGRPLDGEDRTRGPRGIQQVGTLGGGVMTSFGSVDRRSDGDDAPVRQGAGPEGPRLLLTVEEAADLLHLGRTRCYQLVMGGAIRSVKVGRRRLIVRAGLDEFVARLEATQATR